MLCQTMHEHRLLNLKLITTKSEMQKQFWSEFIYPDVRLTFKELIVYKEINI